MEYEEYKRISGRKDISVKCYYEGVEPFYMAVEIDKEDFCRITEKMTPLTILQIGTAFQSRREIEEAHNQELSLVRKELEDSRHELDAAVTENAKVNAELADTKRELANLKLKIAYQPENTIRDIRASLFISAETAKAEAIRLGIITQ